MLLQEITALGDKVTPCHAGLPISDDFVTLHTAKSLSIALL